MRGENCPPLRARIANAAAVTRSAHHLSVRIPNYRLQRAHDELPEPFRAVPTLSLRDALRCLRLKLYDEERGRLVGWRDV